MGWSDCCERLSRAKAMCNRRNRICRISTGDLKGPLQCYTSYNDLKELQFNFGHDGLLTHTHTHTHTHASPSVRTSFVELERLTHTQAGAKGAIASRGSGLSGDCQLCWGPHWACVNVCVRFKRIRFRYVLYHQDTVQRLGFLNCTESQLLFILVSHTIRAISPTSWMLPYRYAPFNYLYNIVLVCIVWESYVQCHPFFISEVGLPGHDWVSFCLLKV